MQITPPPQKRENVEHLNFSNAVNYPLVKFMPGDLKKLENSPPTFFLTAMHLNQANFSISKFTIKWNLTKHDIKYKLLKI